MPVKSKVKISEKIVAFSEYMNFKSICAFLIQFIILLSIEIKAKNNFLLENMTKQSSILWKDSFLFPDQNNNAWINFLDH